MDHEGYPTKQELRKIKKWNWMDTFGLVDYLEERWAYASWGFKKVWGKNMHKQHVLFLELHTAGWSGNESIIDAVLANPFLPTIGYSKWERGGHYYFEINPYSLGFKPVSVVVKEKKVSRQYIHHRKDLYEWLRVKDKIMLVRPIPKKQENVQ